MAEPIVTSLTADKSKISNVSGKNIINLSFKFDIPVTEYIIDTNGTSHSSGIVAGHATKDVTTLAISTVSVIQTKTVDEIRQFAADTIIVDQVDYTELYAEGNNRVNVYGKSLDGIWSSYNQA